MFRCYLDTIAEEINDKLHDQGQITVAELTKEYDLPGDFLAQVWKYDWELPGSRWLLLEFNPLGATLSLGRSSGSVRITFKSSPVHSLTSSDHCIASPRGLFPSILPAFNLLLLVLQLV